MYQNKELASSIIVDYQYQIHSYTSKQFYFKQISLEQFTSSMSKLVLFQTIQFSMSTQVQY